MIKWLRRISQNADANLELLAVEMEAIVTECPRLFRIRKRPR